MARRLGTRRGKCEGAGMLYELIRFSGDYAVLNVFRYITFRSGGAIITSFLFVMLFGRQLIDQLRARQGKGQPIRDDGPQSHIIKKRGTPTMGGLIILLGVTFATLVWANWHSAYIWIVLGVTLSYGTIGFGDDYLKVTKQRTSHWFSGRIKLVLEVAIAAIATWMVIQQGNPKFATSLTVPFFKDVLIPMGPLVAGWLWTAPIILVGIVVIAGAGNSVNLTDGLDGLAIVPVMIAGCTFGLIAYLCGNLKFAEYLGIIHVPDTGELAVFAGALLGAGLGFLWFNAPPAMIFMGDTGSLALGGALGSIAVATKHEIVLAIVGGLFVMETLSVIVQVASYKMTGKRVFRMAPLHHHYEQKGWEESTVVIRFWIIAVLLALVGLATLKLR